MGDLRQLVAGGFAKNNLGATKTAFDPDDTATRDPGISTPHTRVSMREGATDEAASMPSAKGEGDGIPAPATGSATHFSSVMREPQTEQVIYPLSMRGVHVFHFLLLQTPTAFEDSCAVHLFRTIRDFVVVFVLLVSMP